MADGFDFSDLGFPIDGLPNMDPSPDEDAWEAFLNLALERIGGSSDNGLSNAQLREVEGAFGASLPFEIGLLLVMGVPDDDAWWNWDSPTDSFDRWQASLLDGLLFDVEHNDCWLDSWGPRLSQLPDRKAVAAEALEKAPRLFPLFGHRAVPLGVARDETSSDSNPILSVVQTDVITYGVDLADWLHREFDVPLPMWPPTSARWFPFWSEFID